MILNYNKRAIYTLDPCKKILWQTLPDAQMATRPSSSLSSGEAKGVPDLVDSQDGDRSFTKVWEYITSGSTVQDTACRYDDWAPIYDKAGGPFLDSFLSPSCRQDLETNYKGPIYAAEEVAEVIGEERREEARVLDVAAGTGRVGLELARRGFRNLEALDPSPAMLEFLKATQVYRCTYCEYVGVGQNTLLSNYYDAVVVSGGMVKGHIPLEGVEDFIRVCKPGKSLNQCVATGLFCRRHGAMSMFLACLKI
ncbi:methyltransferase-like protein 27 [Oratosquilla oratoria]|uniref:methyltransferase-like protein 27 n=1 Tax=Oratosquilla oratoria TaxID=337810 RepID=UPI003F76F5DC